MNKHFFTISLLLLFSFQQNFAQETDQSKKEKEEVSKNDEENNRFLEGDEYFNPLSPAKAAFYSAIVPGLGQAYNRRYWKIPIVYGALATSMYYYSINNSRYKRVRSAFKLRAVGLDDEFSEFSDASLETFQKSLKQNRDTSLLTFLGLYALQILEASIDAHLLQFNISDKVSFDPKLMNDRMTNQNYVGLSLNFNF